MDSGLLAGAHLVSHVDARCRIVAGQHNGEPGVNAALRKTSRFALDRGKHLRREGFAVEDARGHGGAQFTIRAQRIKLSATRAPTRRTCNLKATSSGAPPCPPFRNCPPRTIPIRKRRRNGSMRSRRCSSEKAPSGRIFFLSG